jgi:hypothetical protein
MVYLCSQWTPNVKIKYFIFDWTICAKSGLKKWISPNDDIRKCLLVIKHGWTINAFWDVNNKKWRKWCKFDSPFLFNNTYGLLVLQWTPNVQINYFTFHCSIYRIFVLNRAWNPVSLQIIIFVYVCSTWSIVELKRVLRPE